MAIQLLNPPFRIDWQTNTNEVTEKIIHMLETVASPIRPPSSFTKRDRRNRSRKKKAAKKEAKTSSRTDIGDDDAKKGPDITDLKSSGEASSSVDPRSSDFKQHVAIGISKILRLLEQRTLAVVLFDRSFLRPSAIAQFIGSSCVASGAQCVCLDGLSDRIAPILNLKSANVIGIKKCNDESPESIKSLINAITTETKLVVLATGANEGAEGGRRKKKRKRSEIETPGKMSESFSYVEATVLVQQRAKKKRK